ncbi:GIY-YIG nuclease family protein [Sessilibacter corallicola]|uniref:GIY-YIG nuclease family protein n=1 Tax=Sessilibacter corallicola TaxID=2904075 RepID=UPI001E422BAE|nr:GIY-YIG nuclease family protein [Sessilibacter corallicola]MCE2029945.1 GIY-YIG nuclease family protein [Sessilibacter corallicola]
MAINTEETWCVYIIETQSGKLYTGITNNLEKRFQAHYRGKGAKYFRSDPPRFIVWSESGHTRSSASKREYEIKKWPRRKKLVLTLDKPTKIFLR